MSEGQTSFSEIAELHDALTAVAGIMGNSGVHRRVCAACGLVAPHPAASVSPAEYAVLRVLTGNERSRQRDVAARLVISRAAVCCHFGRLERRGLVRRVMPPGVAVNHRRHGAFRTPWYEPTPAGHSAVESITLARCAFIAWRLRRWRPSDMGEVAGIMRRLAEGLAGRV
jgi:DNA-binding MarR family transcriptional regulator